MNRRSAALVAILLALPFILPNGCARRFSVPAGVAFVYETRPNPPRIGQNRFIVRLSSSSGQPLPGAHISIEADMTHPGMNPVMGELRESAPGRYEGEIEMNMRGDWAVLFHIRLANGSQFDRQIQLANLQAA